LALSALLGGQPQAEQGSIRPNFDSYKLNPEYGGEPRTLGRAAQLIEERLGR